VYVSVAEEGDGGVGRVISGLGEGDEVEGSEDIVWFLWRCCLRRGMVVGRCLGKILLF
jgi:hypothetical protein